MTGPRFAVVGHLAMLSPSDRGVLFRRDPLDDPARAALVAALIARVRSGGDAALCEMAARFDGATLTPETLEVPRATVDAALAGLAPGLRADLSRAAVAIERFHRAQLPTPVRVVTAPGVTLEWRVAPLERVGVYAPGGRASYPSSVLMGVIPARVAGVREVCLASPPGPDGRPAGLVLAAAALAGADRVFALGGAGAVAAFAHGTERVPAVDRIVGPGNAWVTEAKRQLAGVVPVDSPAGPSEVVVVADAEADPRAVALELLAQAEHDAEASAVLVALDAELIGRVRAALAEELPRQPRRALIEAALAARGALLVAADRAAVVEFVQIYAPEHLSLMLREPRELAERITNAGTICLGGAGSVVFGDYLTGANHVLPTGGAARRFSGLSVNDFLRRVTWQELDAEGARGLAGPTARLARAEGLPAHAAAAELRGAGGAVGVTAVAAPPAGRAAYAGIALYAPDRRACPVDLSDNTNLFGAAPAARAALAALADGGVTRYPGVFAEGLKAALAAYQGVPITALTTGCGSDDLIDSIVRAFCEPGDRLALPVPTFAMVPTFARMNGVAPVPCPGGPGGEPDVEALLATDARLIYLCRPNNPTGVSMARATVEALVRRAPGVVLLDEAYAEFAGDDFLREAVGTERLIVLRTFSKAWGLAGLRIGYATGPPALIAEVEKSRGPYKVNGPAEAAAVAALGADRGWLNEIVRRTVEARAWLTARLVERGLAPWPSAANFVAVPLPSGCGAEAMATRLRGLGVAVRPCPGLPGGVEALRVTVGPLDQLEIFLAAFDRALRDAGTTPPARSLEVNACE